MKTINISEGRLAIFIAAIIGLLIILYVNKCSKVRTTKDDSVALINALQDSLRHYKYNDSISAATISVIQTEKSSDFVKLKLQDQELKDLQQMVKDYGKKLEAGSSVTKALVETVAILKGRPALRINEGDTVWHDSIAYVYPTYEDTLSDQWITLISKINRDSSNYNLKVTNKFSAIVGVDKGRPFVDLLTENPYTTVKSLRTYQVKLPKPKKFGIGPNISYGFGESFKQQVFIGIGLQYNILRL